jgi:excisionase family DNA binding protein
LAEVRPLAVSPEQAAAILGVSRDFLDEHLLHEIPHVRRGRRRLIPVAELERRLREHAVSWDE